MIEENIKQVIKSYKSNQASKYIPVRGDEILTKLFDCEKYSIYLRSGILKVPFCATYSDK